VRIGAVIVVIWLIIGVIAATQRGYFSGSSTNCAKASNTVVTIVAARSTTSGSIRRSTATWACWK
jgi:hypothetical protein